jgi:ion channel
MLRDKPTAAERARDRARVGGHRYGLVLAFALAIVVFSLSAGDGRGSRVVTLFASGGALVLGVVTSDAPARTRRALALMLGGAVTLGAVADIVAAPGQAAILGVTALLCAATIGVISGGLFRLIVDEGVVVQAVLGALAVYLLIGLVFAFTIGALAVGSSGPWFAQGTDAVQSTRAYYSFTTLTTTGFGDYTPATRGGHLLAVLEMLIGQLYLVTVIALLVGNLRRR